ARRGHGEVLLLEREEQLAVHSTGRSAATLSQFDSERTLIELKVRSAPFFQSPPPGFARHPILRPTGVMNLVSAATWARRSTIAPALAEPGLDFRLLSADEACAIVPPLDRSQVGGAIHVPGDGRIDVHETLSSYLRHARAAGAEVRLGAEVEGFRIEAGR